LKKKFMSVPIQYNQSVKFEADDIKIPVEILVMHDKINLNKSNFEMEAIESAKESIKNIPILGYIKKVDGTDSKDFAGHEIELSIKDGKLKLVYLERPIGVIPETNNYEYVEVNGKTYVKVLGYIWKEYLNEGYEILQENPNKSVSMEITVDDYVVNKDGIVDIKSYRYLGVTILGDSVGAGMEGANMQVVGQFSEKFSTDFYEKVESLNNELKERFSNTDSIEGGDNKEVNIQKEGENMSDLSFSATYRQKREALCNALDPIVVRDGEDKIVEETFFYVEDFSDEYVMVEKYYWTDNNSERICGRFAYSFNNNLMTATVNMESWEKMMMIWVTETENIKIEEDRKAIETMSAEFDALKVEVETFKSTISNLESEKEDLATKVSEFEISITERDSTISELQAFKSNVELEIKQSEIEDVISEFEEAIGENEEFKAIKNDAMSYEIEALKEKLYALEGKIKHSKSNKITKKTQVFSSKVSVIVPEVTDNESYYGDAVKYIKQ